MDAYNKVVNKSEEMAVEKLESIEVETYFGKCKCCFNYGYLRTMWEKHIVDGEAEIYGALLTQCFGIQWTVQRTEEDDQICEECICKLRDANTFKKQVVACQQLLASKSDDGVIVETLDIDEVKQESDEYYIEYLDEDILEKDKINGETSDEDNNNDCLLTEDETINDNLKVLKYDSESQNTQDDGDSDFMPDDEDVLDEEAPDSPAPRKRSLQKPQQTDESDTENDGTPKPKWPKKLPTIERYKTYKQYTDDDLKRAVQSVLTRVMNQKQAAKNYHVPRKTLAAKIRAVKDGVGTDEDVESHSSEPRTADSQQDAMVAIQKHRDNIRSVLAYSNATPIRGFWGNGYVCMFCEQQFSHPSKLRIHTREHDNISEKFLVKHVRSHIARLDVTSLKCNLCNTKMEDLESLMQHLKDDHDKPVHFDIHSHLVPFKFNTKELKCVKCSIVFTNFKLLSEHMSDTHFRNYVCVVCKRGFVNKSHLVAHKEIHKKGKYPCSYCKRIFHACRNRTAHERNHHLVKESGFKCNYCKREFNDDVKRKTHESIMHTKEPLEYNCADCGKSYATQRSLKAHNQNEHLKRRPYKCREKGCGKSFFQNKVLKRHHLSHLEKPFSCKECPKRYKSLKSLKEHMYSHTDKKGLKCQFCYKRFVLRENLDLHIESKHYKKDD